MARRHHWKTLGVDSTGEERAIKRAYAKKLKAIDPAADAEGFIKLRAAYEAALNEAQWIRQREANGADDDHNDDEDDWDEVEDHAFAPLGIDLTLEGERATREVAADILRSTPKEPSDADRVRLAWNRLASLYANDEETPCEADVELAFDTLLTEPGMQQLGVAEQIEASTARFICEYGPRAYFLSESADFRFDWTRRSLRERLDWPYAQAVEVARASRMMRPILAEDDTSEIREKAKAWRWLNGDPMPWWNPLRWYRLSRIRALIEEMEEHAPFALRTVDWDKLAAWEPIGDGFRPSLALLAGVMLAWFAAALAIDSPSSRGPEGIQRDGLTSIIAALAPIVALVAAAIFRQLHVRSDQYFVVEKNDRWALGAMLVLVVLAAFARSHPLVVMVLAVLSAAALAFTRFPMLPKATDVWEALVIQRYPAGLMMLLPPILLAQAPGLLMPIGVAAWCFAHAQPFVHRELQARMHGSLYVLHGGLVLVSALLIWLSWNGTIATWLPRQDTAIFMPWTIALTVLITLTHDAATGRHNVIPGTQFYIIRLLAFAAAFGWPIFTLLGFVILRTLPILFIAARDRFSAKRRGEKWHDHGEGYAHADGGRSTFNWWWIIVGVIVVNTIVRIANTESKPPPPSTEVVKSREDVQRNIDEMLKDPEVRKRLDDMSEKFKAERENAAKAVDPDLPLQRPEDEPPFN